MHQMEQYKEFIKAVNTLLTTIKWEEERKPGSMAFYCGYVKIRNLSSSYKLSSMQIAKQFPVSARAIRDIIVGKRWSHIK